MRIIKAPYYKDWDSAPLDTSNLYNQINASWIDNGSGSGLGWSLKDQMGTESLGLRACNRSLSALHAEIEGLLWVASCMKDRRITLICFETDCLDLLDMATNPMDSPHFAS